jgi:hypothetical protein
MTTTGPGQPSPSSIRRAVPLPASWKSAMKEWGPVRHLWTGVRRRQVLGEYLTRRDFYARRADELGLVYDAAEVAQAVRTRLRARGTTPALRAIGEVHTFACIPMFGWHGSLMPDLQELGPVTHFDYTALGYSVEELARADRSAQVRRREMLEQLRAAVAGAHRARPIDWIFCYSGGQDMSPSLMKQIAAELGIPTVNMSLDDKQGWAGRSVGEVRTGAADLTASFDLFLTSSRMACEWHLVEGGRPLYLPEGVDVREYQPRDVPRDLPMSFIGAAYGYRTAVVADLRRAGIPIHLFGAGWPGAQWAGDAAEVFNRSQINLGMGGIEYAEWFTNVKGRDFEVPAAGGGAYLTTFNADLAQHFEIGREILCYASREELVDLARHYLRHPDEAREIAERARARCVREHRWLHRYSAALRVLGILDDVR